MNLSTPVGDIGPERPSAPLEEILIWLHLRPSPQRAHCSGTIAKRKSGTRTTMARLPCRTGPSTSSTHGLRPAKSGKKFMSLSIGKPVQWKGDAGPRASLKSELSDDIPFAPEWR